MAVLFEKFDPYAFLAASSPPTITTPGTEQGLPADWLEGFRRMSMMPHPSGIPFTRWLQMVNDAAVFIDRWAATAAALGWTTLDLFGVGRDAPYHRLDLMGLVPLLGGKAVVALTEETAHFRCADGTMQTFYRRLAQAGRVPLWELE